MKAAKNFTVRVDERDAANLNELMSLGYGDTWAEVLAYLTRRSLDDLLRAGVLTRPKERKP